MPGRSAIGGPAPAPYRDAVGVAANLTEQLVEPVPGQQATVSVRVLNDGDVVDELDLDLVGEPRSWARVVPDRLFLLPGESGVAQVVFAPPRAPTVRAGARMFGVRVRSREDPGATDVEEGTAVVAPFGDTRVAVSPRLSRRRRGAHFAVDVDNLGNAPVDVRLDATDDEHALRYAFSAPAFAVEPDLRANVRLRVRPRKWLLSGPSQAYPFTITVTPSEGPPATTTATYVQRAVVPRWAVRAVLLAILLAALLLALLAATGAYPKDARTRARPSTQKEDLAVKDARTAQRAAAAAQQQVAAAQRQAAASAEQLAEAQKKLASPPPGPLTTPYGVSLTVPARTTGRAAFTWPERTRLALTDLVLTSPVGDTVEVRVLRAGELLFQLYADSPEPRPLAFSTPVEFARTGDLTVEVRCVATAGTGCRPVVYAGGFLKKAG